jgi:prolyl oligopeptidase PreP (S9A serine peptidase family)
MDLYPELFKLAWRKNKSVKEEFHNQNWTRGLWRMQSVDDMSSFVELWDVVQETHLTDEHDTIRWRWTADGSYTAQSAYTVQFMGSFGTFSAAPFGRRRQRENSNFLHGFLCKARSSRQINL